WSGSGACNCSVHCRRMTTCAATSCGPERPHAPRHDASELTRRMKELVGAFEVALEKVKLRAPAVDATVDGVTEHQMQLVPGLERRPSRRVARVRIAGARERDPGAHHCGRNGFVDGIEWLRPGRAPNCELAEHIAHLIAMVRTIGLPGTAAREQI